jgi:phosphopantothenoylcysteine decarboxylase/phosphopantothenate--cysteine ligase
MSNLSGKQVLLGMTGGIAAYKSAELVRLLRKQGTEVRVVMTAGAQEFITPLTLQALSGQPVYTDLLDPRAEAAMGHIELARWADVVLVAPATADFIARLAQGRADDLLATVCLATDAPLAVAPAMNRVMWENPATRDNMALLNQRNIGCFGPGTGSQACGETGPGRMLEPEDLLLSLEEFFKSGGLAGCQVVITAGPTREAIDPVRFISNRSSGKMGYALAAAAREAGAAVTLISGPVSLPAPERVNVIRVETAAEMYAAVMSQAGTMDIFIGAAAVADYRPATTTEKKLKKSGETMQLVLERNPDILATVAALEAKPFTVGLAAETHDLEQHARGKLQSKGVDMIAANKVGKGLGFDADENALQVFWQAGEVVLPQTRKIKLAQQLVDLIAGRYRQQQNSRTGPGKVVKLHAKDSTQGS